MFDTHHALSVGDITITAEAGHPVRITRRTDHGHEFIAEFSAQHATEIGLAMRAVAICALHNSPDNKHPGAVARKDDQ